MNFQVNRLPAVSYRALNCEEMRRNFAHAFVSRAPFNPSLKIETTRNLNCVLRVVYHLHGTRLHSVGQENLVQVSREGKRSPPLSLPRPLPQT